ncbi:hypothetical protein P9112_001250 [Eukaryota sp. TZLM1-RC]
MDDISIIRLIDSLRRIAEIVQQRYYEIGLSFNISKCLLVGRDPAEFVIDDLTVSFINYHESGFRSLVVHDAVRDQLYAICKSNHIEAFGEPIVRKLSPENEDENTFDEKHRADLITLGSDGVIKVVDVVTVDVCKDSAIDFANKDETPLCFAEKSKIK